MTQLITILILYWRISSLADNMWLWHDMAIVQLLAMVFGLGGAANKLSKRAPPRRLFTGSNILSLFCHIFICSGFQIAVYFFTVSEPWFCSITDNSPSCFNRTSDGAILNILPNPKCDYQDCDEHNNIFQSIKTNMSRCDEYEYGEDELYEHFVTQTLFLFTSFQV